MYLVCRHILVRATLFNCWATHWIGLSKIFWEKCSQSRALNEQKRQCSAVQRREVRIIIAVYWHLIHVVSNLSDAKMQMRQWENKEIHLYLIIVVDMEKFPHQDAKTYFIVSPPITSFFSLLRHFVNFRRIILLNCFNINTWLFSVAVLVYS